jgi:hypothetical protein
MPFSDVGRSVSRGVKGVLVQMSRPPVRRLAAGAARSGRSAIPSMETGASPRRVTPAGTAP